MSKMCKNCGSSLTIKQVVMNFKVCSRCATRTSSFKPAVALARITNYKNHINLNFDALVAAELRK
jgi:hypothetical protein